MSDDTVDLERVRHALGILSYVSAERKRLKDLEEPARAAVEEVLRDATEGTLDGRPVVKWDRRTRNVLSQKTLREKFPDVARQCMEVTEVRNFRLVGGDE